VERRQPRLAPRGVVAVDERGQRPERGVLGERERDRASTAPPGEPEERAVRGMEQEARGPPVLRVHCLAEERHVRVVAAEDPPVERLLRRPHECGGRSCQCGPRVHWAYSHPVPEGDALHRAARRLQPLVGEQVEVETPNPRAQIGGIAEKLDGRCLLSVEAVGKNLLFRFEGGFVLCSHLRMNGRWTLVQRGAELRGRPWVVLRGSKVEARQWNGPVLELHARSIPRLGPDILERPPRLEEMAARIRRGEGGRAIGDAILDQSRVAGIGNKWKAEALWEAAVSPWRPVSETSDEQLHSVLDAAARLMRDSLDGRRRRNRVYRLVGRQCSRCGERILSRGQGDDNRMAYWCPGCQA
jgi:endonuclease VIII